jgi:CBS domain containing-hemolysin-like protein
MVADLLFDRSGLLPAVGQAAEVDGLRMMVTDLGGRSIKGALVSRAGLEAR